MAYFDVEHTIDKRKGLKHIFKNFKIKKNEIRYFNTERIIGAN